MDHHFNGRFFLWVGRHVCRFTLDEEAEPKQMTQNLPRRESNKNESPVWTRWSGPLTDHDELCEKGEKLIEGYSGCCLCWTTRIPYMDEETASQFNESLDSSFEGIGAEVTMIDGKVIIIAPFKNSPAEKAGLKPNDQILSIDGESLEGMNLYDAVKKIRGEKGTTVTLEIMRSGFTRPQKITIKRDKIPHITVHGDIKKKNGKQIGYLQITSFAEGTAKEFKEALRKMERKGIDGLIVDVRGNPGGLLTSVEEIVQEFVTKDKPYVQIQNGTENGPLLYGIAERKNTDCRAHR